MWLFIGCSPCWWEAAAEIWTDLLLQVLRAPCQAHAGLLREGRQLSCRSCISLMLQVVRDRHGLQFILAGSSLTWQAPICPCFSHLHIQLSFPTAGPPNLEQHQAQRQSQTQQFALTSSPAPTIIQSLISVLDPLSYITHSSSALLIKP